MVSNQYWRFCTYYCLIYPLDIQRSNESVVHLKKVTDIDFSKLACLDDMKAAAANFGMVQRLEEILMQWCKQIEQVGKFQSLYLRQQP